MDKDELLRTFLLLTENKWTVDHAMMFPERHWVEMTAASLRDLLPQFLEAVLHDTTKGNNELST